MSLTNTEFKTFNHVFENVLKPIIEEHKEDFEKMFNEDEEFKKRVEAKVEQILKNRAR